MSQLRTLVDTHLGAGSAKSVLATMPNLPGLEQEDLQDALQHIGLRALVTYKHVRYVWETSAAFASMGFGLRTPKTATRARTTRWICPFRHILALSLTNRSFGQAYTYMQSAFWSSHEAESVRFELGLENEGEEAYWDRMREVIIGVGREAKRPLDTLLLLGEGTGLPGHPEFVKIVQETLVKLYLGNGPSVRLWRRGDPMYVAAQGAAEFAKRAQASPQIVGSWLAVLKIARWIIVKSFER